MDLLAIGSLLSGGASLVNALVGGKSAKAPGVDYKKLVREAQAAGFNPLTALMAGGAQAYTRDFGPSLSRQMAIGQSLDNFSQGMADLQAQRDRIRLDRDFFSLEQERVEQGWRQLDILGSQQGPVFGPSSRTEGTYDRNLGEYGPWAANVDGIGRSVIDTTMDLARLGGSVVRSAWDLLPDRGSITLPTLYMSPGQAHFQGNHP